jgi:hypothetical protein
VFAFHRYTNVTAEASNITTPAIVGAYRNILIRRKFHKQQIIKKQYNHTKKIGSVVLCNNDKRSRNHCCRGKAELAIYSKYESVALSYPASHAHAPHYVVICGLVLPCFSTLSHEMYNFRGKKINEHKMHILIFSKSFV